MANWDCSNGHGILSAGRVVGMVWCRGLGLLYKVLVSHLYYIYIGQSVCWRQFAVAASVLTRAESIDWTQGRME